MQLMRPSLQAALAPEPTNSHAGLLLQRGWPCYIQSNHPGRNMPANQPPDKTAHLTLICAQNATRLYRLAYQRWQQQTSAHDRFRHAELALALLAVGKGTPSALETGMSISHTYGMPYLPGSSLKGCVADFAAKLGLPERYRAVLFGSDADLKLPESPTSQLYRAGAGCLIWHDAWWSPDSTDPPFVQDIVTPHHSAYYAGQAPARPSDNPVPAPQLHTQGRFYCVIEGDPAWAQLGIDLLKQAAGQMGLGARRSNGYGQTQTHHNGA